VGLNTIVDVAALSGLFIGERIALHIVPLVLPKSPLSNVVPDALLSDSPVRTKWGADHVLVLPSTRMKVDADMSS